MSHNNQLKTVGLDFDSESDSGANAMLKPMLRRADREDTALAKRKRTTTTTSGTPVKNNTRANIGTGGNQMVSDANTYGQDVLVHYGSSTASTSVPDLDNPIENVGFANNLELFGMQVGDTTPLQGDGYGFVGPEPSFVMPANDAFMQTLDQPFQFEDWDAYMGGLSDMTYPDMGLMHGPDHQLLPKYPTLAEHGSDDQFGLFADAVTANMLNGAGEDHDGDAYVGGDEIKVKDEVDDDTVMSPTPAGDSDYEESDYGGRRPSKVPKLNKDGIPRKPRRPRPKLLKWSDNDWKNVALGIVWACGENGIQIPFHQASQVVGESCTAGALQQALLKLRGKQIAEGYQIPSLKMAWTRKNKNTPSTSSVNSKPAQDSPSWKSMASRKRPTRMSGNQSFIVTIKRAYKDADRLHLDAPYNGSNVGMAYDAYTAMTPITQASMSPDSILGTPNRMGHAMSNSSIGVLYTPTRDPFKHPNRLHAIHEEHDNDFTSSDFKTVNDFEPFAAPNVSLRDRIHNKMSVEMYQARRQVHQGNYPASFDEDLVEYNNTNGTGYPVDLRARFTRGASPATTPTFKDTADHAAFTFL